MPRYSMKIAVITLALAAPAGAYAQGVVGGAENGAARGSSTAGPVGAVIGGAVGAVTGGVNGLLGIDQRPRFREYIVSQGTTSYKYDRPVTVGTVLPNEGVTYYDVPAEYGVKRYRYTVVDGHAVLVDPVTYQVVDIID